MNNTKYKSNIQYSFLKALGCGGVLLFTAACSNYNRYGAHDRNLSELSNKSKGKNTSNIKKKIPENDKLRRWVIRKSQILSGKTVNTVNDIKNQVLEAVMGNKKEKVEKDVNKIINDYPEWTSAILDKKYTIPDGYGNFFAWEETLLMLAVRSGNLDIAKFLTKYSDLQALNKYCDTILHIAIDQFKEEKENFEMIDWILDHTDLILNERTDANNDKHYQISKRLLFNDMMRKATVSSMQDTKLEWLERIIKLVGMNGFDSNAYDQEGNCAIHRLAEYVPSITQFNRTEKLMDTCNLVIERLKSSPGFSVDKKNKNGKTAMDIIMSQRLRHSYMYNKLVEIGATVPDDDSYDDSSDEFPYEESSDSDNE